MEKLFSCLVIIYLISLSACEEPYNYTPPKGIVQATDHYGNMYKEILIMDTIGISKQLADGLPKAPINEIKLAFRKKKNDPDFNVIYFVNEYWTLADERQTNYQSDTTKSIVEVSHDLWDALTYDATTPAEYSSLIRLPHPYVATSGQHIEMSYWDSYFIMLGLAADDRWDMVRHMVDNCAYMIDEIGHIPETNRMYTASRSSQPFFSYMIDLLASKDGDQVYSKYLPSLQKEYSFWQSDIELNKSGGQSHLIKINDRIFNRYYDPNHEPREEKYYQDRQGGNNLYPLKRAMSESGWKRSSRWMKDPERHWTTNINRLAPIDLNALLYHLEETILKAKTIAADQSSSDDIISKMEDRKWALDSLHWDDKKNIFEDVNYRKAVRTGKSTLAMVYPLYAKMCTQNQADGVATYIEKTFLREGGLMATDQYTDYEWDAPYGHPPLNYIAIIGLRNYGHDSLANEISKRLLKTIEDTYKATGRITEKYDLSETTAAHRAGSYDSQDAYGWTLGVYLALKNQ